MESVTETALHRALRVYYSYRDEDIVDAERFIMASVEPEEVSTMSRATAVVNSQLLGKRDDAYLTIRAFALQVIRYPARIGTMSTGERLGMALLFERAEWLDDDTYAWAAHRVGAAWLRAIIDVETDLKWMQPPIRVRTMSFST